VILFVFVAGRTAARAAYRERGASMPASQRHDASMVGPRSTILFIPLFLLVR
jgi:hypothetical protein